MKHIRILSRVITQSLAQVGALLTARGFQRKRRLKIKVGFQFFSVHLSVFFQSLLKELRDEPDVETILQVLPHPHFDARDREKLINYLVDSLGFSSEDVRLFQQSIWEPFDIVFYADVFARFPPRSRKNILLNHGLGTSQRFMRRGFYRHCAYDFDTVFCASDLDLQCVLARRPAKNTTRVLCSGSVIFDRLDSPSVNREQYLLGLGLDVNRKTVLFAPHWTRLRSPDAGFVCSLEKTLDTLCDLDVNIVVKLHDMSYQIRLNGGYNWGDTVKRWQRKEGLSVDRHYDDVPALIHAEVIVTDVSSRGLIFAALKKPCILYFGDIPGGHETGQVTLEPESFDLLKASSSIAESPSHLARMVEEAMTRPATYSANTDFEKAGVAPAASPTETIMAHLRKDYHLST